MSGEGEIGVEREGNIHFYNCAKLMQQLLSVFVEFPLSVAT
jgi:hypothetical protein